MLGTLEHTGTIARRLADAESALMGYRAIPQRARKELQRHMSQKYGNGQSELVITETIRGLRRCSDLERQFRVVSLDTSVKRLVPGTDSYGRFVVNIEVPLVWSARLPLAKVVELKGRQTNSTNEYRCKANTPMPTMEAIQALKKHGHLFEWHEVWWVPNEVLVEKLPDPDPILVGGVKIHNDQTYYFELHRWIDENVELGWWSKEGY